MSRCAGIRADGGRCGAQAIRDSQWCFNHHPDYEEQRQRRASKGGKRGGRGRPQAELSDLKARLSELADSVLAGEVDRSDAAVVGQLLGTMIRAIKTELEVKQQQEIIERVEALEQAAEQQKGGRAKPWEA